jgi:hypothetical protein
MNYATALMTSHRPSSTYCTGSDCSLHIHTNIELQTIHPFEFQARLTIREWGGSVWWCGWGDGSNTVAAAWCWSTLGHTKPVRCLFPPPPSLAATVRVVCPMFCLVLVVCNIYIYIYIYNNIYIYIYILPEANIEETKRMYNASCGSLFN